MNNNKSIPELLAPAGSLDCLKMAVDCGADAVYLSGKTFGARQFATNFTREELIKGLNYAHKFGVRVYLTVNTLIKEGELNKVSEYLIDLYNLGVDAILIQDWGVYELARELIPNMELHASTQMTTHNEYDLKYLDKCGFSRVVLSRELSLDEIIKLKEKTDNIELEVFLHGAICYSYSGRCLFSSFSGGRSGNRGMCAQPCRKEYKLNVNEIDSYNRSVSSQNIEMNGGDYLLSPHDLGHYWFLDKLVDSGVSSLKIEGRMRSADYVGLVVSVYRRALDYIKENDDWKPNNVESDLLYLAFNRGFTSKYLLPDSYKDLMACDKPGNRGLLIGTVKKYNANKKEIHIKLRTNIIPLKGDGLFFESRINPINNLGFELDHDVKIKDKEIIIKTGKGVVEGSKVYITRKHDIQNYIKLYNHNLGYLNLSFSIDSDNYPILNGELNFINGGVFKASVRGENPFEKANKKPTDIGVIEKQCLKLGNYNYVTNFKNKNYNNDLFLRISDINKLRRDLLAVLDKMILSSYLPDNFIKKSIISKNNFEINYPKVNSIKRDDLVLSVIVNDFDSLKASFKSGVDKIYFEANFIDYKELYETCLDGDDIEYDSELLIENLCLAHKLSEKYEIPWFWKWPDISHDDLLEFLLDNLKKLDFPINIMTSEVGLACLLKEKFNINEVEASSASNATNHKTIQHLNKYFNRITLTLENKLSNIQMIQSHTENKNLNIILEGNPEIMTSRECIISRKTINKEYKRKIGNTHLLTITNNKNQSYPLKISNSGHTIIKNNQEVSLIKYLPQLIENGIYNYILDTRDHGPEYTKKIIDIYQHAIHLSLNSDFRYTKLIQQIQEISNGTLTNNNF